MAAAVPRYEEWLDAATVRELSKTLHDPPRIASSRQEAFDAFGTLALEPNPLYRKYGYFAGVDLSGIEPLTRGDPVPLPAAPDGLLRIVHDASGSRFEVPAGLAEAGVQVEPIEAIWREGDESSERFLRGSEPAADRLTALGYALINRGYRLTLPDRLREPVRVQDLTLLSREHEAVSVRRSVRVGKESRLLMSEELYSTATTPSQRMAASSIDLDLAASARATLATIHAPDPTAVSLYHRSATVGPSARLGWVWAGFGGFRTKCRNSSRLEGNGSDLEDLQVFYGTGHQAYDSGITITHTGTDTHGQSITRGVFQDEARGMSRGLVRIEKEARKTISYLSEHAMLLSRGARSDTIPILEILCRDVKATHSTSVAPVDPEKVFYLESRGISKRDAIRMISEGFLAHVLDRAPVARLRDLAYPMLETRWAGGEILWKGPDYPALPPLQYADEVAPADWRFDAKLR